MLVALEAGVGILPDAERRLLKSVELVLLIPHISPFLQPVAASRRFGRGTGYSGAQLGSPDDVRNAKFCASSLHEFPKGLLLVAPHRREKDGRMGLRCGA